MQVSVVASHQWEGNDFYWQRVSPSLSSSNKKFLVNNLFTDLCQTAFEESSFPSNFIKEKFK
jgi:hypothetical protein